MSLRALRVRKELSKELISQIGACDLSEFSKEIFEKNMVLNDLGSNDITYFLGDTNRLMRENQYDIVDLDPYGSMMPFLHSAINSLGGRNNPSLLCVTCTDTKVLMGPERQKCYYDYGACRGGHDILEE